MRVESRKSLLERLHLFKILHNSTTRTTNTQLQQIIKTNWSLKFVLLFITFFINISVVSGAGLRLQACDEDFRQMANWLCARPGEKTPCYKHYFDVPEWKENYTQKAVDDFGQTCCEETGCSIAELKKHCCLEDRCFEFCYTTKT